MGALRSQIMIQFCCGTMILIAAAFILGVLLAEICLPLFNTLANKTLTIGKGDPWLLAGLFIVLIVCLGTLPGLFSALIFSKYQPVDLFLRRRQAGSGGYFSRSFIMIQFGLSIFLIICTLVMANQLQYLKTKNLGFRPEQIVVIPFHTGNSQQTLDNFRTELNHYAEIINVSGAISYPGGGFYRANVSSGKASLSAVHIKIDYDFLETFGIMLKEGRPFSRDIPSDTTKAIIINQSFANRMGWPSALGKKAIIEWMGWELEVIGVVNDFHYSSFHENIGPLVFYLDPFVPFNYFFVKIRPEHISETITLLKRKWNQIAPEHPFEYFFLTQKFYQHYRAEERWHTIVTFAALVAIFIACFGLFGLSTLIMTKRTKEIGIRKVLGASVTHIVFLLSNQFTKWIVLANIIAWPFAFFVMDDWLQNFAYRIDMGWWTFLIAGAAALFIAWMTISIQAIKTAIENPIKSLRYE
jgi:putative ABC transport system permease protein